ncbi:muramidase family protein [Listeria ilorinensis]|uniref:muramidase family protein n=1 Tax=Listeria ilorinensis TaxID=2867439 RepID=UPI001EF5A9E8|nr:LysM peptidoglycan-binding domain-containing protein [Listeria ilorinensis]
MELTRKERIEAEKKEGKKRKKKDALKTGTTIASLAAVATTIAVPAYSTVVSADEVSNTDTENEGTTDDNSLTNSQTAPETTNPTQEDTTTTNTTDTAVSTPETSTQTQPAQTAPQSETKTEVQESTNVQPSTETQQSSTNVQTAPISTNKLMGSSLRVSSQSAEAFINSIAPDAQSIAAANDLYASVMIAQACLESGYGSSTLSSAPNYNLFGIKGTYNGQYVEMKTLEDDGSGNYYQITAKFRKYPNYAASLQDNANVLHNGPSWNPNYYAGAWKSNTNSYKDATRALTGTYATDTSYANKLNSIIERYDLTQYDTGSSGSSNNNSSSGSSTTDNTSVGTYYTVQSGDTLYKIANKYGTSVANLKSWNNLKSDTIYPGQKLIVSKSSSNSGSSSSSSSSNTNSGSSSSSSNNSSASTYTVKSGDSLWKISQQFGVSVANLKSWNNLSSDTIHPGQVLKVTAGSSSSNSGSSSSNSNNSNASSNSNSNNASSGTTYTVQSGDSLWKIANKYGTSIANLKSWNKLSSDTIHPGQKLIVSKSSGSSSSSSSSSSSATNNSSSTNNNASSGTTYTVQSGDSLWKIANKYGTSVTNLKSWNKLSSDTIHPGQKLIVSKSSSNSSTSNSSSSNSSNTASKTYTVQKGDTLWGIAQKNHVSVSSLQSWNKLNGTTIYVGQKLVIK